jgi:protein transport protein SEC31
MEEEEAALLKKVDADNHQSTFSIHAHALQTLIEKLMVFQSTINYVGLDLAQTNDPVETATSDAKEYKLSMLYDRYCNYAELLASQGLSSTALRFVAQTPSVYTPSHTLPSSSTRERLSKSVGLASIVTDRHFPPEQKTPTTTTVPPLDNPFAEVSLTQNAYQVPYNQPGKERILGKYTHPPLPSPCQTDPPRRIG